MMENRTITPEMLASLPDSYAPVSGARCRDCGASAYRRIGKDALWTIENGAAYCPQCAEDREAEKGGAE